MEQISIIVPIYNSEKYLRQCINSILEQDYENYEILLIDDGSKDQSLRICQEYRAKHNNISVLELKHAGVSNARNTGIAAAKGKYICFIDSDDIIDRRFCSACMQMMLKYDCDIVEVDFKYINEKKRTLREKIKLYNSEEMIGRLYSKNGIRTVHITNKLFNKKIFENIKFLDIENEDEYIIHKLLFETNKNIAISNQKLYTYRIREDGRQRKFNSEKLKILNVFSEREQFFKNNEKLVAKNKIAKLDMIIYLSYICNKNKKIEEKEWLYQKFAIEYRERNIKLNIKRKIKYYLYNKCPNMTIWMIELKKRRKY